MGHTGLGGPLCCTRAWWATNHTVLGGPLCCTRASWARVLCEVPEPMKLEYEAGENLKSLMGSSIILLHTRASWARVLHKVPEPTKLGYSIVGHQVPCGWWPTIITFSFFFFFFTIVGQLRRNFFFFLYNVFQPTCVYLFFISDSGPVKDFFY